MNIFKSISFTSKGCVIFYFTVALLLLIPFLMAQKLKPINRKPRHILDLSYEEKIEFLNSFDFVLSDIDGVMWNERSLINGAGEGAERLKKTGKKYVYLTNNSVRSSKQYLKKFKEIGLDVDLKDIIHPAQSVVDYLKKTNFEGLIYCIGTQLFKDHISQAGFRIIDGPNKIFNETFSDLARDVFDKEPVKAVIIDVDINLSAAKLIRAHQYLIRPDCQLIAGASDMLLPISNEIKIIGPGPFIKVLEEASQKSAITLGKPGRELCNILIDRYSITNMPRTLMIGDMLEQDIGFGNKCGFQTLLVLSGGCQSLDSIKLPEHTPSFYADSMGDFISFFDSLK